MTVKTSRAATLAVASVAPCANVTYSTRITIAAGILATAIISSAHADPRYVLQDLGALPSNQGVSQAYGINNSGHVVGAGPGGAGTSWIWDRRNGMRSLGTFPGGDGKTRAIAINEAGTVVGFAEIAVDQSSFVTQAFVWTADRGMQPISGIGQQSEAFGINDPGAIVGGAAGVLDNGFVRKGGKVVALGVLSGSQPPISIAYGVNNRGQVVGGSGCSPCQSAFLWDGGKLTNLGILPGSTSTEAHAISDTGQVVGLSGDEAFLWDTGRGIQGLGFLDQACFQSDARAINNHGTVVGYGCVSNTTTPSHAFVWDRILGMLDLNKLVSLSSGDVLNVAYGINEGGQIVGVGILGGAVHAFLLDPTF
jgi:probable HAF family extracellular repeat protein